MIEKTRTPVPIHIAPAAPYANPAQKLAAAPALRKTLKAHVQWVTAQAGVSTREPVMKQLLTGALFVVVLALAWYIGGHIPLH